MVRAVAPTGEPFNTVVDATLVGAPPAYPFLTSDADATEAGGLGTMENYLVANLIAQGGMGLVFEALDRSLMRKVAIKVLAPQLAASEEARTRFLREARSAAAVHHENVLAIHAVGETNGFPYLVMPLVKGESLQARIDRAGPLPLADLLFIAGKIATGLAAAHAADLVHRDIKPDNILLESGVDPRVWIADFGLARALQDDGLTLSGAVTGTPRYLSPEQAEGKVVDHRTDLFSLGSVLYAMATGSPPFLADAVLPTLRRIIEDQPKRPSDVRPDLPSQVEELILDLLQKKPDDRPPNAISVAERIEAIGNAGRKP